MFIQCCIFPCGIHKDSTRKIYYGKQARVCIELRENATKEKQTMDDPKRDKEPSETSRK